jgi:anti-sigma factor NepR-like protein
MMNRKPGGPRSPMEATTPGKSQARLGRDIQAKIGQQLRAMYDDVLNQGVPDRFSELLNRLEQKDEKDEKDKR